MVLCTLSILVTVNSRSTILVLVWMHFRLLQSVKQTATSAVVVLVVLDLGTFQLAKKLLNIRFLTLTLQCCISIIHGRGVQEWNVCQHHSGNSKNKSIQCRVAAQVPGRKELVGFRFHGSSSTGKNRWKSIAKVTTKWISLACRIISSTPCISCGFWVHSITMANWHQLEKRWTSSRSILRLPKCWSLQKSKDALPKLW